MFIIGKSTYKSIIFPEGSVVERGELQFYWSVYDMQGPLKTLIRLMGPRVYGC